MRAVNKEVSLGRVKDFLCIHHCKTFWLSPVGMVPKKGSFRLIHHLSYHSGTGVNDFIDKTGIALDMLHVATLGSGVY